MPKATLFNGNHLKQDPSSNGRPHLSFSSKWPLYSDMKVNELRCTAPRMFSASVKSCAVPSPAPHTVHNVAMTQVACQQHTRAVHKAGITARKSTAKKTRLLSSNPSHVEMVEQLSKTSRSDFDPFKSHIQNIDEIKIADNATVGLGKSITHMSRKPISQ